MIKKIINLALVLLVFACKDEKVTVNETKLSGLVFGTSYNIIYSNKTNYQKSIDSLFWGVNKSLSTYIPSSDISRINKGDSSVVVDDLFLEVFNKAKRIYAETDGYFDPTVCSLVNSWGFGYENNKKDLDSIEVAKLIKKVGYDKVFLLNGKVHMSKDDMCLDFNSIAKGYGIDVIGRFFETKGIESYLVEIGGEIRVRGLNRNNKKWRIAIDDPNFDGTRTLSRFVSLENQSMASSGNYRKFRMGVNGQKYVHTINPKTGFATESDLLSATVYGDFDCADVDAYATAFMAMGFEKTLFFLKKHDNIKVSLIYVDENNEVKEFVN